MAAGTDGPDSGQKGGQFAAELQSRSVQLFVTLASIGDAVVTTDDTGSVTFLNPMAESLTGWTLEEAVGEEIEAVFMLVDEATGIEIPNTVRQAIRERSKVVLPSDAVLIMKDGSPLPVDDSAAPIIDMDGNVLGAVLVFRDITERKRAEELVKHRAKLDRMTARISTAFITSPVSNVDAQIEAALKEIGEFYGADRSYVYLYNKDGTTLRCTHEWCADGIECLREKAQEIPVSIAPYWGERIRQRQFVYVSNLQDIPEWAAEERALWASRDVQALVAVPMSQEDKVLGFVGMDSVRQAKEWPEETVDVLHLIGNILASAMARRDALQKLEAAREQESKIGSRIQQTLLLGQPPTAFADFRVAALTIPSSKVDGDFYDFLIHPNRCLDIIFGDVMGKGVPAALLAAGSKTEFLRSLTHLLAGSARGTLPEPEDIVNSVHSVLTPQLMNLDSFVTLSYVRFDPKKKKAVLVDSGNTRLIRCRAESGDIEHLSGSNLPLGFSLTELYSQAEFDYDNGDVFVLYSDGVTEARSPSGRMFGMDRLEHIIVENRHLDPQQLVNEIKQSLIKYVGPGVLSDDFTCVVIEILSEASSLQLESDELKVPSSLDQLAVIRSFVRSFCEQRNACRMSTKEQHLLELAVTEVASNISRHAYRGKRDELIWVRINLTDSSIKVRLSHNGAPFVDWDTVPPPSFDGSQESGFGVFIVKHAVDIIDYGVDDQDRQYIELTRLLRA